MLATRNITITRSAGAPATPICIPIIAKEPLTPSFKGAQLKHLVNDNPAIQKAFVNVQLNPQILKAAAPQVAALRMTAASPAVARVAVAPRAAQVLVAAPQATTQVIKPAVRAELTGTTFTKNTFLRDQINTERLIEILRTKQEGTVVAAPPAPPPTPPAPAAPQQERYGLDGIIVLAYVCKRVPLSPNPDPSLQW